MIPYAIIGGTGMELIDNTHGSRILSTPYGNAKVHLLTLSVAPHYTLRVAFLSRHGTRHQRAPHEINYRANIYALHTLGVRYVLCFNAVGSCTLDIAPGSVAVVSDYIDFTKQRAHTFDTPHKSSMHTSMEQPYSPILNDLLEHALMREAVPYAGRVVYACTEGPRFETAAEVHMLSLLGAQVVGMTGVPEAPLARELNMHYASAAIVTNYGTGLKEQMDLSQVDAIVGVRKQQLLDIFFEIFQNLHQSAGE